MNRNELRIINALLSFSRAGSSSTSLGEILSRLATLTDADLALLHFENMREGGLSLFTEFHAPERSVPIREYPATSDFFLRMHALTGPLLLAAPEELDPALGGFTLTVAIPFAFSGRRGWVTILTNRYEKLKALSKPFFSVLGDTLGLIVRELTMAESIGAKLDELELLQEIGQSAHATLELSKLLPVMAYTMAQALKCESSHVLIESNEGKRERYSWSSVPERECADEVIHGFHQRILVMGSIEIDYLCPRSLELGLRIYLSGFPLTSRGTVIGTCVLMHHGPLAGDHGGLFANDRKGLLKALSNQVSMAVANALNYAASERLAEENRNRAVELDNLYQISQVLAGTLKLDEVLRIILTACTIGHGLGFNRAALFLINDKTTFLQGMMGVGPESAQEAWRIWGELSIHEWNLAEALKMSLKTTLSNVFDHAVKTIRLPVQPESGVLARAVLDNEIFNVPDITQASDGNAILAEKLGTRAFAVVPLLAEGRVLGVIFVDNLYNGRPISEPDLRLLATLAGQAAMAVANAQVLSRLEKANLDLTNASRRLKQSERLAALGEMAANMAHEVRNPLVSVGGYTRRLERRMDRSDPNRKYTNIIIREIERLEKFLNEILLFSREFKTTLAPFDVNDTVREAAELAGEQLRKKNITLRLELADGLPQVHGDRGHIAQILGNFFSNSIDALEFGGEIAIKSYTENDSAVFEFSDNGGGVPEEILANIFNPFFTTKRKGTGLGLPLVNKMVRNFGGAIDIQNKPGESITFIVRLPQQSGATAS